MTHEVKVLLTGVLMTSALHAQRGGLSTQFSRAGDTTIARVNGAVPASAMKRLVQTMRIEPTDADTGFYAEAAEVAVDAQGRVWVFDGQSNSIFLFGSDGKLIRRVGRQGGGPGEYQGSDGLAIMSDGRLAALDFRNGRISFVAPSGDYLTSWPVPASLFYGRASLFVDSRDALRFEWRAQYADGTWKDVLVHLRNGGGGFMSDTIPLPPQIEVPTIRVGSGPRGFAFGLPFSGYMHRAWLSDGAYATANGVTGVITIPQAGGGTVRVERNAPPVAVTAAERAEEESAIYARVRRTDPTWLWTGPSISPTKPRVTGMHAGKDGNIWVQVAAEAEQIPVADRAEQRAGQPPPRTLRSTTVWEVFARNGTFLGRVRFPKPVRIVHAFRNDVWVAVTTSDGFTAIVKYRIEPGLN